MTDEPTDTAFAATLKARGYAVPSICYGTGGITQDPDKADRAVPRERAHATIRAILENGQALDTSRNYGGGYAEACIGEVLREAGGLPEGFLLSTKLDCDNATGRFDGDRARRSLEESLTELGLERVPVLYLHDPEFARSIVEVESGDGALRELMRMREEGIADTVGLGAGDIEVMMPLLRNWDFQVVLTHNRWTVLNRNAGPMIDYAVSEGLAVINAAVYASGIFAKGADTYPRYVYRPAEGETLAPVRRFESLCRDFDVAPAAAALQFSLRDPNITTTIVGVTRPERVEETQELAGHDIPEDFWDALETLPQSTEPPVQQLAGWAASSGATTT